MSESPRGQKTKQALAARIQRLRTRIRKAKASWRKEQQAAALLADAQLGAIVREQHPELAKLLIAASTEAEKIEKTVNTSPASPAGSLASGC